MVAIAVTTDDGRKLSFAFLDTRTAVSQKLGGAPVKQLRFALATVKQGKQDDSCISDVSLSLPGNSVLVVGAAQIPPLAPALHELRGALSTCDDATLRARVKFPLAIRRPPTNTSSTVPPCDTARSTT